MAGHVGPSPRFVLLVRRAAPLRVLLAVTWPLHDCYLRRAAPLRVLLAVTLSLHGRYMAVTWSLLAEGRAIAGAE